MRLVSREGIVGIDPGIDEADLVNDQTAGLLDHEGGGVRTQEACTTSPLMHLVAELQ
jgi:hypothetical protein